MILFVGKTLVQVRIKQKIGIFPNMILFFIQVVTGFLYQFTGHLVKDIPETSEGKKTKINLLKAITKPLTSKIIKVT